MASATTRGSPKGRKDCPWASSLQRTGMIPSPQDDLYALVCGLGEMKSLHLVDQCMDALECIEHRVSEELVLFKGGKGWPTCNVGKNVPRRWMQNLSLEQMAEALGSLLPKIRSSGREKRLAWLQARESPPEHPGRGQGLGWNDLPYSFRTWAGSGRYSKSKTKASGSRWRRRKDHILLSFLRSKTECPSQGMDDPNTTEPS